MLKVLFLKKMPRKNAKSKSAKVRLNKQFHNLSTGKFEFNNNEFEFTYSEDNSDDDYIAERLQNFNLVWTDTIYNEINEIE